MEGNFYAQFFPPLILLQLSKKVTAMLTKHYRVNANLHVTQRSARIETENSHISSRQTQVKPLQESLTPYGTAKSRSKINPAFKAMVTLSAVLCAFSWLPGKKSREVSEQILNYWFIFLSRLTQRESCNFCGSQRCRYSLDSPLDYTTKLLFHAFSLLFKSEKNRRHLKLNIPFYFFLLLIP